MEGSVTKPRYIAQIVSLDSPLTDESSCYHCGLTVSKQSYHYLVINGVQRPMCCMGCLAAAEFIQQTGAQ